MKTPTEFLKLGCLSLFVVSVIECTSSSGWRRTGWCAVLLITGHHRTLFWQSHGRLLYIAPYFRHITGAINKLDWPEQFRVLHNPSWPVWCRKPTFNKERLYCQKAILRQPLIHPPWSYTLSRMRQYMLTSHKQGIKHNSISTYVIKVGA